MATEVRVRFAPSPTGFLHIGGARTALFNWLFARAQKGKFLLRIEDTDRERSQPEFTKDILASLKWLGLDWDEEVVYQSARFPRYAELARKLHEEGKAYYCQCTPEELDRVRDRYAKLKQPFRYPGTCREKNLGPEGAVLRVKNPRTGETRFEDLIRGPISYNHQDIDDWVMVRADGSPTYNFSVVVDDHDQNLTHILRGDDHINNTPKQILLFRALGWTAPFYAHLPMILGPDRTKLSKRHGASSTLEYRKQGYLPAALINFLVRLGWSHGDQEVFSREELVQHFGLEHIGKAPAVFSVDKLNWLNGHYLRETPAHDLIAEIQASFAEAAPWIPFGEPDRLLKAVLVLQGKVKTLAELVDQMGCLFGPDPVHEVVTVENTRKAEFTVFLKEARGRLEQLTPFTQEGLEAEVKAMAVEQGIKPVPISQALRFAVTGGKIGPGIYEMLELQGKSVVLRRIDRALEVMAQ